MNLRDTIVKLGIVNVSQAPLLSSKTITQNGTYSAATDHVVGYSEVTVNVPEDYTTMLSIMNGTIVSLTSQQLSGLAYIKPYLFYNVTSLRSIRAQDVVEVGSHAFDGCDNLSQALLSNVEIYHEYAFANCGNSNQGLRVFPTASNKQSNITYIGSYAFANTGSGTNTFNLSHLSNCSYIGEGAFYNCPALTNISDVGVAITVPSFHMVIEPYTFYNCVKLSKCIMPKVSKIGSHAFENTSVKESNLTFNYLAEISDYAFSSCYYMSGANEFGGLSILGEGAFMNTRITAFSITNASWFYTQQSGVIKNSTFYGCSKLSTFNVSTATKISSYAFYGCSSLSSFTTSNLTYIGTAAFYDCKKLSSIDLTSVTTIDPSAFQNAGVESISLNSLTWYIQNDTFNGCSSLAIADVPKTRNIRERAFYNCTSLSYIILPKVEQIHQDAFVGCSSLLSVYLGLEWGPVYVEDGETIFDDPFSGTFYVRNSLYSEYMESSFWLSYSSQIHSIFTTTYLSQNDSTTTPDTGDRVAFNKVVFSMSAIEGVYV